MAHPLRIGLRLMGMDTTVDRLRAVWRIADDAGFDHVWGFDHLAPVHSDPDGPCFEGWTLLASMAEVTRRTRIGLLVTGNLYRHPAVVAKMATTVDHLSGGRLEFGIGTAWAQPQFEMLGMDFPSAGERVARLDEACEYLKLTWTAERATFAGRYYQLSDAVVEPKPIQRPYPPIWVGGNGERMLRVTAKHADVWNPTGVGPEEARRLSDVLDRHCAEIGRDPAEIRRSRGILFDGADVDTPLTQAAAFLEMGFTEMIVIILEPDAVTKAEVAADKLLPRLRSLG